MVGMRTHRLAAGNKGDLLGKGAEGEATPALLGGLSSKPRLAETGKRDSSGERKPIRKTQSQSGTTVLISLTHTYTYAHMHTCMHVCTHAHTYTHTHSLLQVLSVVQ